MKLEMKPSSLVMLMEPFLRYDPVYHVLVTKSLDFLLTQYTIKATRLHLNEIRARSGTGVTTFELGEGLRLQLDLSKDLDAFMYDYLSKYGRYEGEVGSILSELITKDTTFIDVGANIGYFTILFSRLAKEVYAFEPVPSVFSSLSGNISLNNLQNVRALQYAVSKERGRLRIFESRISEGHDSTIRRSEHDKSILVDGVSLDEVIEPSVGDVVMKVDTEGSEMDVLLGALGLIRSGKVSAIVLEWARRIYPRMTNLRERFALYSSLGTVEVLDELRGSYKVTERHEIPDFCNLLITVRK